MPSLYGFGRGIDPAPKGSPHNYQPPLPADFGAQIGGVADPRAWHTAKATLQRSNADPQYAALYQQLYANPMAAQSDTETAGPRRGMLGRVGGAVRNSFGYDTRLAAAKIAALFGGITAAAGGPVAMGAGAGGGGAVGAGGAAGWVDPFVAGGGAAGGGAAAAGAGFPAGYAGSGPWMSGAGAAGGAGMATGAGAAAAGTPWYNSFWGQTAINSGLNLAGGALQNRAQAGADKANRKAIEDRIRQALAALSPEHIMALAQQFMPQMAANMSQSGQTAIQAVRAQAARTGQLEGPRALSFEAGVRSKQANDVQSAAFERAFGLAGNQASAITGAPYQMQQPRMGYADALTNSANQAWFARAMSQQPQQQTGVPYRYPYQPGVPYYGSL